MHSSLSPELCEKIEAIQSTALKIILADRYKNYRSALSHFQLDTLSQRRQKHMERFALKCTQDKYNNTLFPKSQSERGKDIFHVNFARTSQYLKSTIPQCQRLLNEIAKDRK